MGSGILSAQYAVSYILMRQRMCWTNVHIVKECIAQRDAWSAAASGYTPKNIMNLRAWLVSFPKNSTGVNMNIALANAKKSDALRRRAGKETEEQMPSVIEDGNESI